MKLEQLPNIIGNVVLGHSRIAEAYNAFSISTATSTFDYGPNATTGQCRFNFSAHNSTATYVDSGKVYPLSLALNFIIKA